MTRSPTCPNCHSSFVVPDSTNGGTGRDVCMNCGHRAAVREFYPDVQHGDITMTHRTSDNGQAVIYQATLHVDPRRVTRSMTETPLPTHAPAPIRQYKDD